MTEHIPDSSGLPLRAMVMVFLFLGVIFLLVGFQAMGSGPDSDESAVQTTATTAAAPAKSKPAPKPDVRVYNISDEDGIAGHAADQLRGAGWNVTEVDDMSMPDVEVTTVYFGDGAGEQDAAAAVGKLLDAPVEPRTPDLAEQPPGIIVVVTP